MAPLIKAFEKNKEFNVKVCVTAQHREMLDQVLDLFDIKPDYDLNIMKKNQTLSDVTANIIQNMEKVYKEYNPDIVLVHGDTTTTFVTSLSAFYHKIQIGHVEAGLRTSDLYSPWPEEANRKLTGVLANYHFAPTLKAYTNLIKEGISEKNVFITGNTVIDALYMILEKIESNPKMEEDILKKLSNKLDISIINKKFILVTGHRRENFGEGFLNICEALKEIALKNLNINIIYPVHLNPNVRKPVFEILSGVKNIYLIEPLEYLEFVYLMNKSYLILTDSGGIQEEAPELGKPVLVLRDITERPEAIEAGTIKLVGTDKKKIVNETNKLLINKEEYEKMSKAKNPFGDGTTCEKIINILKSYYDK